MWLDIYGRIQILDAEDEPLIADRLRGAYWFSRGMLFAGGGSGRDCRKA